ncbi:hypothetical protein [Sphingomonas sp.]
MSLITLVLSQTPPPLDRLPMPPPGRAEFLPRNRTMLRSAA